MDRDPDRESLTVSRTSLTAILTAEIPEEDPMDADEISLLTVLPAVPLLPTHLLDALHAEDRPVPAVHLRDLLADAHATRAGRAKTARTTFMPPSFRPKMRVRFISVPTLRLRN